MSITVTGPLSANGEKFTVPWGPGGAEVRLRVNPGPGFPCEVRLSYGNDHRRAECVAVAARRGANVVAHAEGCFPRTDHSVAAVVLSNVSAVQIDGVAVYP